MSKCWKSVTAVLIRARRRVLVRGPRSRVGSGRAAGRRRKVASAGRAALPVERRAGRVAATAPDATELAAPQVVVGLVGVVQALQTVQYGAEPAMESHMARRETRHKARLTRAPCAPATRRASRRAWLGKSRRR